MKKVEGYMRYLGEYLKNILIIEDEISVSEILKAYLEREGYKVSCADSGLVGLKIFKSANFDLVILDLMLADISGESVCKTMREFSDVHIFMLTAKADLKSRINGLDIGADEYLVKPFSPRELTAKVNALSRRWRLEFENKKPLFDNGSLVIDYEQREITLDDNEIKLTSNEFGILYQLVLNKGAVLSREQIISGALGFDFDGYDRTIDVHIRNIRRKIEKDTKNPIYIITVVKSGYKFGGELNCIK